MSSGERAAGRSWAAATLRRGWVGLLVAGVLFGAAGATSAALVAGARRAETAYDRLHRDARGADAIVFGSQAGLGDPDWTPLTRAPEVRAAAAYAVMAQTVDGADGMFALAPADNRGLYRSIEVPHTSAGRAPEPGRSDEVVVSAVAHRRFGIDIGDELTYRTMRDGDEDGFHGPVLRLRVVGVGEAPIGFTRFPTQPIFYLASAFLTEHPEVSRATNLMVRLRNGAADIPALRADAERAFGVAVPVLDLGEAGDRVRHGTEIERNGLLLLAAALGAIGLLVVGQALARSVDAGGEDAAVLEAMGMTRAGRALALSLPAVLSAVVAGAVTVIGGVLLSPLFPIGLARRLDPDVSVHADWLVLAGAAVAVVVGVVVVAAVASWLAADRRVGAPRTRPSWASRLVSRLKLPLPPDVGARLALEGPSARSGALVRPAVVATMLGVAGILGAATVASGLNDAVSVRARTGQRWEGLYFAEDGDALRSELLARSDVLGAAGASYTVLPVRGTTVATFAFDPIRGASDLTLLSGRAPQGRGEMVLGPATAHRLGVGIGEHLRIGDRPSAVVEVVGLALMPQAVGSAYDDGGWVTSAGMDRLGELVDGNVMDGLMVHFRHDGEGLAIDPLVTRQGDLSNELEPEAQVVTNLRDVGRLPWIEVGFFALLTTGSVGHLLATSWRRRRRDLGVLRALGVTPRQAGATVAWQGVTIAVAGLAVGLPLGLAAGGSVWRSIVRGLPVAYRAPLPVTALIVTVPVVIAATALLALDPARRVARLSPTEALRVE